MSDTQADGYWVVMETLQGGGTPDYIHGPFWNREQATAAADILRRERGGRRDLFEVGHVEVEAVP
jgi:hypothetical protein